LKDEEDGLKISQNGPGWRLPPYLLEDGTGRWQFKLYHRLVKCC